MARKIEDTCQLEICCFDLESVCLAEQEGIAAIELCTHYTEGGLFPGERLIQEARQAFSGELRVMIRARPGDFIYSDQEVMTMCEQVQQALALGANGITFGCLNSDREIAWEHIERIQDVSEAGITWTFHRAIDLIRDVPSALQSLTHSGVHRVLTSGGRPRAVDAMEVLQQYQDIVNAHMSIVAAGHVRPDQIPSFRAAGLTSIHSAASNRPDGRADAHLLHQLNQQWCNLV
ncbi:MAG: hypothetical protein K9I85_08755 [Saprospiraceae bacterium]|nr:hypothetical protein [Saprospiraceae bacterium]